MIICLLRFLFLVIPPYLIYIILPAHVYCLCFSMFISVKLERTQPSLLLLDDSVTCVMRTAKFTTGTDQNCVAAFNTWCSPSSKFSWLPCIQGLIGADGIRGSPELIFFTSDYAFHPHYGSCSFRLPFQNMCDSEPELACLCQGRILEDHSFT